MNGLNQQKTLKIDTRCKEVYCQTSQLAMKESPKTLQQRHTFWNYMMNISMQNTLVQISKNNI